MRESLVATGISLAAFAFGAQPAAAQVPAAGAADMAGDWTVDLRPSLEDAAYSQPMSLAVANDRTLSGEFYGSPILAGRAGTSQGRTCAAFRTEDGSGPYHHSACLVEGRLVGQSWGEGRGFVLAWTAERD